MGLDPCTRRFIRRLRSSKKIIDNFKTKTVMQKNKGFEQKRRGQRFLRSGGNNHSDN
ncbi:hypothetical protein YC2023_085340 [Brassica napus]